ncbi:hypothetical protein [Accumulibacter sp.]|uniref:hypothetical protein n=1 Tax=Accumulibacter sp. TaxID=2053492 RepID=UPI0028C51100|nr:hypothetical protein [Accumulibacter sp.]
MKRFHVLSFLLALASSHVMAMSTDAVALEMSSLSVGHQLAADDPAVARTRAMLEQVSKLSGDDATAIFAACRRYIGHLHDAAQIKATPLELLAALAVAASGTPINDTLQAYVAARKAAPEKTHAGAMALLAKQK